jgi:hypothetical protein
LDPETLEGRFVVEVGVRQAWPFLTFSDPHSETAAEIRLYIDTEFRLEPGSHARATTALIDLHNMTVTDVEVQDDGGLVLRFDGDNRGLLVSGTAAHFTTQDTWWLETRSAEASDALLRLQQWYARQRDGE